MSRPWGWQGMPPEIALNAVAYLRLYGDSDEKNYSPLQVEVSPVSVTPHIWSVVDLCAAAGLLEPNCPVRSRALHSRVK